MLGGLSGEPREWHDETTALAAQKNGSCVFTATCPLDKQLLSTQQWRSGNEFFTTFYTSLGLSKQKLITFFMRS
jgi:hypothetical protein